MAKALVTPMTEGPKKIESLKKVIPLPVRSTPPLLQQQLGWNGIIKFWPIASVIKEE